MENPGPLILDISSDEEAGFGDGRRGGGYGFERSEFTEEDCFWLTRLLDEVDGNKDDDDSDDVVVVSEVCAKPSKKSRLESLKPPAKAGDWSNDSDDDCVVLDGDPDKAVVVNAKVEDNKDKDNNSGSDSDDLEIVGEKGESSSKPSSHYVGSAIWITARHFSFVACRDFPHARHLCVKFVFASTPHEAHCSQCHCYVCDSLAPCPHWGTGPYGHCNANDKDEYWKAERKRMKKGLKPMPVNPLPITPTTGDTFDNPFEAVLPTPQVSVLPQRNSFLQNQVLKPPSVHPCTLSSNVGVATGVNQGRIRPSVRVSVHNPRPEFVLPQLHPTHNDNVPSRNETNNAGSRGARPFTPLVLKQTNGHVSGSLPHRNSHPRYHPFHHSSNGRHGSTSLHLGRHVGSPVFPRPMPSLPVRRANYLSSQPPMHSSSYSSSQNGDPTPIHPQMSSQPYLNCDFGSSSHLQLNLPSQRSMETLENLISLQSPNACQPNSPFPSPTDKSHQSDGFAALGGQLHSRSTISSPTNVGDNLESQSSQPLAHFSPTNLLIDDLIDIRQGNHIHGGLVTIPTDFGINNCGPSFSCANQEIDAEVSQHQGAVQAESSQLSSDYLPKDNDHLLVAAPVENSQPPFVALADGSSQRNGMHCHFTESTKSDLNLHLDNWMFENDSFPGALEVPLSPGWNEFSPGPASIGIDTGTLFDI